MGANTTLSLDLKDVVLKLKDLYVENLSLVDPDKIVYVQSTARSKNPVRISRIKSPFNLIIPQRFILTKHTKKWDELSPAHQHLYVFRELMRIENIEEGELKDYPIKDFDFILAKFGLDWESQANIIDILTVSEEQLKQSDVDSE